MLSALSCHCTGCHPRCPCSDLAPGGATSPEPPHPAPLNWGSQPSSCSHCRQTRTIPPGGPRDQGRSALGLLGPHTAVASEGWGRRANGTPEQGQETEPQSRSASRKCGAHVLERHRAASRGDCLHNQRNTCGEEGSQVTARCRGLGTAVLIERLAGEVTPGAGYGLTHLILFASTHPAPGQLSKAGCLGKVARSDLGSLSLPLTTSWFAAPPPRGWPTLPGSRLPFCARAVDAPRPWLVVGPSPAQCQQRPGSLCCSSPEPRGCQRAACPRAEAPGAFPALAGPECFVKSTSGDLGE